MNNILNKAIITKVDNVTRVDFIKAKEQVKYNPDELEILKAELEKGLSVTLLQNFLVAYWTNNRGIIIKLFPQNYTFHAR